MKAERSLNAPQPDVVHPLWTRDFTIITLGTVVSMLGSAVSGFALGLLVLDNTNSVLLYALFQVCYCLPRIVLPLLAGPYLDRFSRKRVIYSLDFTSSALFLCFFLLLRADFFNYTVYLVMSMLIGAIDSVYAVAYDSFYPTLISKGNFSRAYSIASLLYPLATTIMVPIASVCYKTIGLAPLFLFNSVTFCFAAIAETQIRAVERHQLRRENERFSARRFIGDFKGGLAYLKQEKGLATITKYFFLSTLCGGLAGTLILPYFKMTPALRVEQYAVIMAVSTVGRLVGGMIHYRFKYPPQKKFAIAVFVYASITFFEGGYLFFPYAVMLLFNFLTGLFAVTSYNIRISSTQNYLNDEMRGRFNGIFQMLNILGNIMGQLIAGALGDVLPIRGLIAGAMLLNLVGVFAIMVRNREHVKKIYNVQV